MQFLWIVSLVAAFIVAVFAVQNHSDVTVKLIFREVSTSVAILVFISAAAGAVIMFFLGLPRQVRSWREVRNLRVQVKTLKTEQELMHHRAAKAGGVPDQCEPESKPEA